MTKFSSWSKQMWAVISINVAKSDFFGVIFNYCVLLIFWVTIRKSLEKHLEFHGKQIILQIWEEGRNFHLISSPSSLCHSISDLSCYYWDKSVTWGSAIVHMFFLLLLWIGMLEAIQKLQCHKQTSDTRQENQCF